MFDVDFDIKATSRSKCKELGVSASICKKSGKYQKLHKHISGIYIGYTNIPVDAVTNLCAIPYHEMEDLGFVKIDCLVNHAYNSFGNKQDLLEAYEKEPDWSLLLDREFVANLPQLGKHCKFLLEVKPTDIHMLADVLALIRPAKTKFKELYIKNPEKCRKLLYEKPAAKDGRYYKKSQAYGYAGMIISVMNKRASVTRMFGY